MSGDYELYHSNVSDIPPYYDDGHYESFISSTQTHTAVFGIILTILTILVNLIVIASILSEKRTRVDVYFLQIVNISLANLLIGSFVIPLTVYSILYPWDLGEVLCKSWIIFDVLLPFASILMLAILNIDRLLLLTYPKVYSCLFQTCLKQIILMIPWMLSLVIVVPFWTYGALPYQLNPGECVIMIIHSAAIACSILTYFVPLAMIVCLTLKILIVRMQSDRQYLTSSTDRCALKMSTLSSLDEPSTPDTEQTRVKNVPTESIVALCLANFIYCSMWFPYQFVTLLMTVCSSHLCMPSAALSQTVTWAATASAGIVPLVWFVESKVKRSCISLVCRTAVPDSDTFTEADV